MKITQLCSVLVVFKSLIGERRYQPPKVCFILSVLQDQTVFLLFFLHVKPQKSHIRYITTDNFSIHFGTAWKPTLSS